MKELVRICRYVRDTDSTQHRYYELVRRFGSGVTEGAMARGLIECQTWQHEASAFVDLTAVGEAFLVAHASVVI